LQALFCYNETILTKEYTVSASKKTKMATRTKVALWLLITPTALLVIAVGFFALLNALPYNEGARAGAIVLAQISFFVGIVAIITWLPALVTGIVMLVTPLPKK
jgi:formate/nitrite transporter FocA (FNT family)